MSLILSGTDGLSDVDGTAATPAIRGTDANTGIFFYTDIIGFSEGVVESMRLDSSANLQFNSGYGSVATAYGCRAWVNFNGTGTVAIRASGNVSSITDNGTGDYTINFTTAMPDANYSAVAMSQKGSQEDLIRCFNVITDVSAPTVNSIRLGHAFSSSTANDTPYAMVSIFR